MIPTRIDPEFTAPPGEVQPMMCATSLPGRVEAYVHGAGVWCMWVSEAVLLKFSRNTHGT